MNSRQLAQKTEPPLSLGRFAGDRTRSSSAKRENTLLLSGLVLLLIAVSMVASTLFT